MRVLQITKWFIPYRGGVETVVEQLAEGLIERDIDTRVLTCNQRLHLGDKVERIGSIPVVRSQSFGNYFGTPVSLTYPFHYRQLVREADVVHMHAPFPVGELVYSWGDLRNRTLIVTFHADPGETRWQVLESFYRPVISRVLERADQIVVTSPQMRDGPELLQEHREKCTVVPLASNVRPEHPSDSEIERAKNEKGVAGHSVLLGVGRMVYYKGFQYAIEAMQGVDAELILVGEGEDLEKLKRRAQELGVADSVHFPGYVSKEELSKYYAMADIFVFPSIASAEAFGIVQVEAMAHGLPVINTRLPTGVPFVSKHEETGFTVEPKNAAALEEAINYLLEDESLRHRMSENARKRASKFSKEKMVDRYLELYR
jgi:rhamnosyl/mannosyltransferase